MFKNYLTTAFNNLLKNKLYSVINIVGLAIGLAACILITLYVQDELSYDKHWQKAEQIYRLNTEIEFPGTTPNKVPRTATPVLPALTSYFSQEIETGARIWARSTDMAWGDIAYNAEFLWADKEVLDLFQLNVLAGNLEDTFTSINNIALSEEVAALIFAARDPIGEVLSISPIAGYPVRDYIVTAVYRFPSENSVFSAASIASFDDAVMSTPLFSMWNNHFVQTYVRLNDNVSIEQLNTRIADFTDQNALVSEENTQGGIFKPSDIFRYVLQPMAEVYLNPWSENDRQASGNTTTVLIFSLLAVLVLLIACINFMVLTTAKSTRRAKEVGMRKVMGAKRGALIVQFLGEALLVTLLASLLGLVLLEIVMPLYGSITGKELSMDYGSPYTYLLLLSLVAVVGTAGGFYPAILLSGFRPATTLRGNHAVDSASSFSVKNLLVVFQFCVSVTLIIATAFVFLQARFASSTNLGFDPQNVLVVENLQLQQGDADRRGVLKQEVDQIDGVLSSSLSMSRPAEQLQGLRVSQRVTLLADSDTSSTENHDSVLLNVTAVDNSFFQTYKIPLIAGRNFDLSYGRDRIPQAGQADEQEILQGNLIINEAAVRQLGLSSAEIAVGRTLRGAYGLSRSSAVVDFNIIGVATDSRFHNARAEAVPEVYAFDPGMAFNLAIAFDGDPQSLLDSTATAWSSVMGNIPFRAEFVEQIMQLQFADVQIQSGMLAGFSLLAVLLACLGLLGMSAFVIERRTKEIGLRKVMGAKVRDVVRLLVWQFSKPVLVANLIAWPFTVWIMVRWLESFSNRIDSLWLLPLCLAVGVLSLVFMWVTVAGNTTRIARRSPIHALRYE